MMHWGGEYGMGFGMIFMILLWGLAIWGVISLIKSLGGKSDNDSAKDMLKKRFARGELNKEEFEEALQLLQK